MVITTRSTKTSLLKRMAHHLLVVVGAGSLTLAFFLVLPLIQAITTDVKADTLVTETGIVEPPPPVEEMENEPEPPPEPEEQPPELNEAPQQMDLSQLSLALNPGGSGGFGAAGFAVKLSPNMGKKGGGVDSISFGEFDQKPRPIYQANPVYTAKMRAKAPGTVYLVFWVDERGKVLRPTVDESTDPVFDRSALNAIKKWKFEPGKRKGKPSRYKVRQQITFPKR